jgi:hypothetical protein
VKDFERIGIDKKKIESLVNVRESEKERERERKRWDWVGFFALKQNKGEQRNKESNSKV